MRLALVTVVVPSYDEGIAFYVGSVGFDLQEDSDLGGGRRWVVVSPGSGGTGLLLAEPADDEQQSSIGRQAGGRVAFFLQCEDFAGAHARMLQDGVEFLEQPRLEPYGWVAVWRDPWGNRWDLLGPAS